MVTLLIPPPEMGLMSWVVLIIIVLGCFAAYAFIAYAQKFSFGDETPEQREETDTEITNIIKRKMEEETPKGNDAGKSKGRSR